MSYWKNELRKFGLVVGGVFAVLAAWLLLRSDFESLFGRILGVAAVVFLLPAFVFPPALKPLQTGWMFIAHILGWINTRLILGIVFYVFFTIVRFFLLILGKDPMHRRPDPKLGTYWVEVKEGVATAESLEHPF